jgi:hypothetical protein
MVVVITVMVRLFTMVILLILLLLLFLSNIGVKLVVVCALSSSPFDDVVEKAHWKKMKYEKNIVNVWSLYLLKPEFPQRQFCF